jgi:hypothetical protein
MAEYLPVAGRNRAFAFVNAEGARNEGRDYASPALSFHDAAPPSVRFRGNRG